MGIPHLLSKVTDSIMLILSLKCSIKVVFLIQLSILLYSYYTDLVFLAVLYKWSAIGIWVTVCEDVSDNAVDSKILSRSLGENHSQSLL